MLSFTLLGQVVLTKDGVPLTRFRSQKEAALLIYLAHSGQSHEREYLAALFWPNRPRVQALRNLRTVLARLRKQIGDSLVVTRSTLSLSVENRQNVDSARLLQTLDKVWRVDSAEKAHTLQTALEHYQGDFLADFDLSDAPQFNHWIIETREHIYRQVIAAYEKLARYALATDDVEYGLTIVRRWHQTDPLDETAAMLLIQLLVKQGKVGEANAEFERTVSLLKEELDVEPPAAMTALIADIRPKSSTHSRHNLPPENDQFIGRKAVQLAIGTRLDHAWCRLVTIVGPGGVGKTRLATTIARSRLSHYPDGVWFVDLSEIDLDDDDLAAAIATEIATILELRLSGSSPPIVQLQNHLQHKRILLVLDNFEHLLTGVQAVIDLIQGCQTVQLLVTSREVLRLRAEWVINLRGLAYPANKQDSSPSDALELFASRRAQQHWEPFSADDLAAMREITRRVEGLPLAIELAAALTRDATIQEIADQLRDGFDTLATSFRDTPARHRSLYIVFEMSWQTLTQALQQRLAQLSIFRGGFTKDAALLVVQADAEQLAALAEKSLLTYDESADRYTLHAIVRSYARAKRQPSDVTPQKHAIYYLTLLAQHTETLQKQTPQHAIALIQSDIDNVRHAWQTALAQRQTSMLADALTSLSLYYQMRGLAHEGEAVMHSSFNALREMGEVALATRVGLERARFQNRLGLYNAAIRTIKTALQFADQCDDRWAEGMGHVWWGESLWRLGEYKSAENKLNHALNIANAIGSTFIIGWSHHQLGIIYDILSRFDKAYDHLQQACAAWRILDNTNTLSVSLNSIGLVQQHQGDIQAARKTMEQALAICTSQNNRHLKFMLLNNLSSINIQYTDYLAARYYSKLGLELATETGNLPGQGDCYINLGIIDFMQGETATAIVNLERGLQITDLIGNRPSKIVAMRHLANIMKQQDDLQGALQGYKQALEIAQQDGLKYLECVTLIDLAELYYKQDATAAKQYRSDALALAAELDNATLLKSARDVAERLN